MDLLPCRRAGRLARFYGRHRRSASARARAVNTALNAFLRYVEVLDFPEIACLHYAKIRAGLKTLGTMIGANDLFIAAHARSLGLTLVTNNTREFARVPKLAIENWMLVP
ncbi:MAG: PIN domain-containing protein [Terriglobales bacterium]